MSLRHQASNSTSSRAPPPSDSGYSGISAYAKSSAAASSLNNTSPFSSPNTSNNNGLAGNVMASGGSGGGSNGVGMGSPSSSSNSKPAPLSIEQSRATARTHFTALRGWLARENVLGTSAGSRNTARDKLTRLTRQQFQELSTDVYDELMRRIDDAAGRPGDQPFLSVRSEFHPKRNQARQKLATLPLQRFRDLASDVYFELERRYPEFVEEELQPQPERSPSPSAYSPPATRTTNNNAPPAPLSNPRTAPTPPMGSSTGSINRRIPTPTGSINSTNNGGGMSNDVVVPNKSTMVLEESSPLNGSGANSNGRDYNGGRPGSSASYSNGGVQQGSSSYGQRPQSSSSGKEKERDTDEDEYESMQAPGQNSGSGGAGAGRNVVSRASETSSIGTRFIGNYAGSAQASEAGGVRKSEQWEYEEKQKLISDYEYKITILQNQVGDLQRESEEARNTVNTAQKNRETDASRIRDLESQIRSHRERADEQTSTLQKLRDDHSSLQTQHTRLVSSSSDSSRLRAELDRLTRERVDQDELQTELSSMVDELREVNGKYEELLEEREREKAQLREMDEEAKGWRRKYEQAKTELRNIKATSQMYSAAIKTEGDYMPASADGVIADTNVTAFQTSIDDLLQAARAKETASILPAMRAVVSAVDKIDRDVQAVDNRRLLSLPIADQERLQSIKANTNATLSNLMTASKNHATSFGVSPVSLVDAAASHLSSAVIDLVRILRIRKTSAREREEGKRPPLPPVKVNGFGGGGGGMASPSQGHFRQGSNEYLKSPTRSASGSDQDRFRGTTSPSYDSPNTSSFDRDGDRFGGAGASYGSGNYSASNPQIPEEPEEEENDGPASNYDELKNYLEHQTEAIVHSIQSLLSAIRSGAQAEQLNENLTRIITIVSSIVAISKDALPEGSEDEGREILQDLTENCDKLSGMSQQSQTSLFDKQTKQAMASASFGVAKSLKALNALLDSHNPA